MIKNVALIVTILYIGSSPLLYASEHVIAFEGDSSCQQPLSNMQPTQGPGVVISTNPNGDKQTTYTTGRKQPAFNDMSCNGMVINPIIDVYQGRFDRVTPRHSLR